MRIKPYTNIGIKRMKCFKCGEKAAAQWQICSDSNQYRPVCLKCEFELNELVLKWAGFDDWEDKLNKYKHRINERGELNGPNE